MKWPSVIKDVSDVIACVIDYGTFIPVAEKLAETMKRVYYHSPFEHEYQDARDVVKGTGLARVERLDNIFAHPQFEDIDLFVFTDIGFTGLQQHLAAMGKPVWGHMGGTDLELYRDFFVDILQSVGLPTIKSEKCVGLRALATYLRHNNDKWVKVNRYRHNMETWHHQDWQHSARNLDSLAVIFGPIKEEVVFVVQDTIDTDLECGYDGWCIDGEFPLYSFQGDEDKNEAYLGALVKKHDLPPEIAEVNEKMAPVLRQYGYRDFWATEIRVAKDGTPYFIDATPRMPGQSGEYLLENYENLAEVIWLGAHGILIEPVPLYEYGASATIHFEKKVKDDAIVEHWNTLAVPKNVERWLKFCHYCKRDGAYQFARGNDDEAGVVIGVGYSPEDAVSHLKDNAAALKGLPVQIDTDGFPDLIKKLRKHT